MFAILIMKDFVRILLLFLWLFAIVAPSALALLMDVENPIVVTNLNEEEQQEAGKKTQSEEKIANDNSVNFSLIAQSNKAVIAHYYRIEHIDYTSEILLPPPEIIG